MAIPSSSYTNLRDKHGDQQTNLLDIISTSLLTVNASLASIQSGTTIANLGTVNASLASIQTFESLIRNSLLTVNTSLASIKTFEDLIRTSLLTVNASLASIHTSPIVASENHIGEVGTNTTIVQVTPIVSLATYAANDCVGGGFAILGAVRVNAGTGVLQSITLQDLAKKNAAMEIFLFKATSLTTYTDNAALDVSDADLGNCIGWVEITASDYKSLSDNSVACVRNLGLPIKSAPATKSLYCVMRTTGTPTYLGTVDLKLTFGILRD